MDADLSRKLVIASMAREAAESLRGVIAYAGDDGEFALSHFLDFLDTWATPALAEEMLNMLKARKEAQ